MLLSMCKYIAYMLCLMIMLPLHSLKADAEYMSRQEAYDSLLSNQGQKVLALAKGDREVLLAILELEKNRVDAALAWLSSDVVNANPLAALIKGEAFRRKSLAAALRAGSYAHAAQDDIRKLGKAELTPALIEADKRLQLFMQLDSPPILVQEKDTGALIDDVQDSVKAAVKSWLSDWQSREHKAYMSHYDSSFHSDKYDYQSWSDYKFRINQKKKYIHITTSDIKVIADDNREAGEGVIVSFQQHYESSNYSGNSYKELYLQRESEASPWLILYEGQHAHMKQSGKSYGHTTVESWVVNLASFQVEDNAALMMQRIQEHSLQGGDKAFVSSAYIQGQQRYRVRVGFYASQEEALRAMHLLCAEFELSGCWVEPKH